MLSKKEIICPNNLLKIAKKKGPVKAVIVNAGKKVAIESTKQAVEANLIVPVFVGDKSLILEIAKDINFSRLPFTIDNQQLNKLGTDIAKDLSHILSGISLCPALKWCLSTVKKAKVFVIIYQANENSKPVYKEEIAKLLPEYSYKTIATIVDEGTQKGYYIPLRPDENTTGKKGFDRKVKNIRLSLDLVSSFYNWNIERISRISKIIEKYK